MLNVAKLGTGQERYYLDSVASGVEDYYLGNGEEPGQWTGRGSELLDLDGAVEAELLHRVLEGRDPSSGVRFSHARKDRVPGFDLTFSAPKSVSVLWALTAPDVSRQVRAAHDSAVDAALEWMEREACRSQRGVDGTEHLVGGGFVAAKFFHRTSRAGDPQLHTHVLVANMTRCDDGQWRALDGHALYWQAQTGGYLYKAHLRDPLTRHLGVDWQPVRKGAAEIVDIPEPLIRLFSTRRREIEDETRQPRPAQPTSRAGRGARHPPSQDPRRHPRATSRAMGRPRPRRRPRPARRHGDARPGRSGANQSECCGDRDRPPALAFGVDGAGDDVRLPRRPSSLVRTAAVGCADPDDRAARPPHHARPARRPPQPVGPYPAHSTRELIALERRLVSQTQASVRTQRWFALFRVLAMTGIRRGELCGLCWIDVDLDAARLAVRQSLTTKD